MKPTKRRVYGYNGGTLELMGFRGSEPTYLARYRKETYVGVLSEVLRWIDSKRGASDVRRLA